MKSILIVDDDADFVKLYEQKFTDASFSVECALTIKKAEELLQENKYDVILLDIVFPKSDALPTLKGIREDDSLNKKTPVIALTNLEKGEKTQKALETGADEVLLKVDHTPGSVLEIVNKLTSKEESE
jgi:two-component system alkaline phosphatase synthesis response regulator PhoP